MVAWRVRLLLIVMLSTGFAGLYRAGLVDLAPLGRWWSASADEVQRLPPCEAFGISKKGRECYEAYLIDLMKRAGGEVAVAQLARFEGTSTIVKTYCHGIAHTLGGAAYDHYGGLGEALRHAGFDCFSGYYHGAIKRGLQKAPDYAQAIRDACVGTSQQDGDMPFYQCVHGLGHGAVAFRQYDLELAVRDCDLLPTNWRRDSCHGGVFMENIDARLAGAMPATPAGRLQDDGSDFWPCLSIEERYRPPCFRIITARMLPKHGRNFGYVAKACDGLATRYRALCFQSYGRDAAGEGLHITLRKVNELCDAVPADVRDACYETAAAVVTTHFADPGRATEICERAGKSKRVCEQGRNRIVRHH